MQDPILLKPVKLDFTPNEFYIAGLIDERKDPSAVAWLIPPGSGKDKAVPVDLVGGGKAAMEAFVLQSLARDESLRPVIVRVKELRLREKPASNGSVEGELALDVDFDLKRTKDTVHLVSYQGGMRYTRPPRQKGMAEMGLSRALGGALEYLHQWMEREKDTKVKLARGVKLFINDYTQNRDDDTVFYNVDRPLKWDDFRGKPQSGRFSASVFPGFSWEAKSEVVEGYIHFHIQTKVYMLKSSSWVREGSKTAYGLNHEQRHFDIVKLVVERFKRKLLGMEFSTEDHDSMLGYYYVEVYREMNRLQDEYDRETQHGLNKTMQEKWNRRIDEELREFGVGT